MVGRIGARSLLSCRCGLVFLVSLVVLPFISNADPVYTVKAGVSLRKGPDTSTTSLRQLDHNQTLSRVDEKGEWVGVAALSGERGYVRKDMVSDTWIKVHKQERRLFLMKEGKPAREYRAALCPSNPLGDKVREGDGATPEGRFYICEMIREPAEAKYGARSLRLSYPNIEDARRGLKDGLINFDTYLGIVKDIKAGRMPNQKTSLGSSIRIHGGGSQRDWTLGCVALDDRDVIELYDQVSPGTRVEIYKSAAQDKELNATGLLNRLILEGSRRQLTNPALYTREAMAIIIKMRYPLGDIRADQAVCTDIIIRALRHAGIDLQALLHEDILLNPSRYSRWIKEPNYYIDHRRTRNLQTLFNAVSKVLPNDITQSPSSEWQPGDIVTMDTGIQNGTIYDHIGILDARRDNQGFPLVINIWTTDYRTSSMDLLGNGYPTVVGHFRLTHPFDYQ